MDGGETNYITATLALYLGPVQRVPEPAGAAGHLRAANATDASEAPRIRNKGPEGPFFASGVSSQVEDRNRLRRAPCGNMLTTPAMGASIAGLMHQQARIARKRRRVAAHVDDALRRRPPPSVSQLGLLVQVGHRLGQREAPSRGGSTSQLCRRCHRRTSMAGRHLEQVARDERVGESCASSAALQARFFLRLSVRARHQRVSLPSMPSTSRAPGSPAAG